MLKVLQSIFSNFPLKLLMTISKKLISVNTKKEDILNNTIGQSMAAIGLKVISYAFKDMPLKKLNEMMHSYSLESPEFRSEIESNLIYLCTFGLDDPLRESIQETVTMIKFGDTTGTGSSTVNIKMVTGDHIETARYVGI